MKGILQKINLTEIIIIIGVIVLTYFFLGTLLGDKPAPLPEGFTAEDFGGGKGYDPNR